MRPLSEILIATYDQLDKELTRKRRRLRRDLRGLRQAIVVQIGLEAVQKRTK